MEAIQEGFTVFLREGDKAVGAVRHVLKNVLIIYVENGGDFEVPKTAVRAVHDGKVMLDTARLDPRLRAVIRRAHMGEDPRIP